MHVLTVLTFTPFKSVAVRLTLCWIVFGIMGCRVHHPNHPNYGMVDQPPVYHSMAKELNKTTFPDYIIEPPDVLFIEGVTMVPKAPYRLKQLDAINIEAPYAIPDEPIQGSYLVEQGGMIYLGELYGSVRVLDLTVEEAQRAIESQLAEKLRNPTTQVRLDSFRAAASVTGSFRVGPDGAIRLGGYGSIQVTGLTVPEAKQAIERTLSTKLENPQVSVVVAGLQSKGYYVIMQGGGLGDGVFKFPSTGNETVLDAISNIQGLQAHSSKKIWIARPTGTGEPQILPVDWFAITQRGSVASNYQVLPGDRVFVAEDKLVSKDTAVAKLTAPLERVLGFTLLGTGTATRLSGPVLQGGGNPQNRGI